MEPQNQTSTLEYVKVKPIPLQIKPYEEMSEAERAAWINYTSNWIWRATFCLIDLKDFNPSPRWIAKKLNIRVDDAVDAIEGLEAMGIIRRQSNGKYIRTIAYLNSDNLKIPYRNYALSHLELSSLLNSRVTSEKDVRFGNYFFASTREKVREAVTKIEQIMTELCSDTNPNNHQEVFGFCLNIASMTPNPVTELSANPIINELLKSRQTKGI